MRRGNFVELVLATEHEEMVVGDGAEGLVAFDHFSSAREFDRTFELAASAPRPATEPVALSERRAFSFRWAALLRLSPRRQEEWARP